MSGDANTGSGEPAGGFSLSLDARNRLVLHRPGMDDVIDVSARRGFPWSKPGRFISLRSSEGKELLLVDDLDALPEQTRRLIEQHLDRHTFIPRIERVDELDTQHGYQLWRVQTDRGPVEFRVQEREDVRFLPDGRYTVRDVDGNLYELPRRDRLDEASRRRLEVLI